MVSGGINVSGKTDLHIFDIGSLTAERYCREVLDHMQEQWVQILL
jgi:hypothetical protein